MRRPSLLSGALIGGVLMIPLIAISYLGQQAARLAFVPFDLFDWIARSLPAALINFGRGSIESVVAAIQVGDTSNTAKAAENLLGIVLVVVIGVIAGALFFVLMNRIKQNEESAVPGLVLGVITSLPFLLFTFTVNLESSAEPVVAIIWIVAVFAIWGLVVGWTYNRLTDVTPATPERATVQTIDRRNFLIQLGAASATITVVGAGLGSFFNGGGSRTVSTGAPEPGVVTTPEAVSLADLPNADDPVTPAPGTRSEVTALENHYRIDIRSDPNGLVIPEEDYQLVFTSSVGVTEEPVTVLTLDEIRNNFEPFSDYITMSCISNPVAGDLISTLKWTGARMQDVLEHVGIPSGATHLKIIGGDGFDETVALDLIASDDRIMLCYEWEDQPLTTRHGFPLRIHIPNLYGMKQPKWIISMEYIRGDQEGYWVRRGWDKDAVVRSTSVIDTIATDAMITDENGNNLIPIGGIAWAGDRQISKVEVRVDQGEWVQARLRSAINERTWNIWRYDWAFTEGNHTFEVRCVEGNGTPQIESRASTAPSGATGIHTVTTTI